MLHSGTWHLVHLKRLSFLLLYSVSLYGEVIEYSCNNLNENSQIKNFTISHYKKQLIFEENIYLFKSYEKRKIFAQRRTIFMNSFLEFDEKTKMLTEVKSWIHKITKNQFICKVVN